jgi:hypothetical protein
MTAVAPTKAKRQTIWYPPIEPLATAAAEATRRPSAAAG